MKKMKENVPFRVRHKVSDGTYTFVCVHDKTGDGYVFNNVERHHMPSITPMYLFLNFNIISPVVYLEKKPDVQAT
jgi:hypothetical protein